MNTTIRDRVLLPFAIPVGVLAAIAAITVGVGWILLNIPHELAVWVALMAAVNILIAASILTWRPRFDLAMLAPLTLVTLLPLGFGGLIAAGLVTVETEGGGHGKEEAQVVAISAQNLAFDKTELKVPADTAFKIKFDNKEAAPHNVEILTAQGGSKLFTEAPFSGPKTVTWTVKPLAAGTYYFQCLVHPNMSGSVVAEASAHGPEGGEAEAEVVKISAKNNRFSTSQLSLPAGKETKLELNNEDSQPHNVEILTARGGSKLFTDAFFTGPKKVTWDVPALDAGTYYFQCQVHPDMNGTVTVT